MLKRTLIAVAVVALLAGTAQALGPDPFLDTAGNERGFKIEPIKMDIFWPFVEYQALDVCVMPVKLKVGILVQVYKCHERKIVLAQVDCADIGKGAGDWPCYSDCENVSIRTNFPIKVGTRLFDKTSVLNKTANYIKQGDAKVGTVNLDPANGWQTVTVCVDAWQTRLWETRPSGAAGQVIDVGKLAVTVKPNV